MALIGETLIHEIGHYFGLSEEEIEAIEEHFWGAKKRFGQHFLEPALVTNLSRNRSQPTDVFLEIGPGRGALLPSRGQGRERRCRGNRYGLATELAAQAREGLDGNRRRLP